MSHFVLRVVGALLDKGSLRLYLESGDTHVIPQGDPKLAPTLELITPILLEKQVAVVDLTPPEQPNPFKDYEEQTEGIVRFFRVAKSKLKSLLSRQETSPAPVQATLVTVTSDTPKPESQIIPVASGPASMFVESQEPVKRPLLDVPVPLTPAQPTNPAVQQLNSAVAEIMAHATPASAPGFTVGLNEDPEKNTDTIVAVVEGGAVAGVEQLTQQFDHSLKAGTSKNMEAFMARVAKVASVRQHSVEDLLKFLRRGDLPIAADGSIIIYKSLYRRGDHYVDPHTRRVTQKVGDYVCMDPSMVDHNRSAECSNGLHVGRRQYMGGFGGDVIVLAKVAPEDVIAVPNYDANKMRVCGYHILFELPEEARVLVRQNLPFTQMEEAQKMLGAAMAGQHIGKLREVRITKEAGHGLVITDLVKSAPAPDNLVPEEAPKAKVIDLKEPETVPPPAPTVDPLKVAKTVAVEKIEAETRVQKARRLYNAFKAAKGKAAKLEAAQAVFAFKKQAKVGWDRLGIEEAEAAKILETINPTS